MLKIAPRTRPDGVTTPRVLVVEDDTAIVDFVRAALEDEGYAVASAKHGAVALEIAETFRPDVILLDLRMPIMDGWSFVEHYRRKVSDPGSIVLLSGVHESREIAENLRADAVLPKPVDLDVLLATVHRCVSET